MDEMELISLPSNEQAPVSGLRISRERVLSRLRTAMTEADVAGAYRCADRLQAVLHHQRRLADNIVLVAYGGGKDSSYTLAFIRAIQLIMSAAHGSTFTLRTVTNRHAGMPRAVMDNISRAYRALGLAEDPDCEALLVDGDEVRPFQRDAPLPAHVMARNRLDLLMTGHRTAAEARPMFCNACNLSMVNAFGLAAVHQRPVNVIITGDSRNEQRAYYLWVNRLARRFGRRAERPKDSGFRGFLETTDNLAQSYFADIYGPDAHAEIGRRRVAHDVPAELRFFSIFDDTNYSSTRHWQLLSEFLEFEFDDLAFSFTESDCGNPTLMAHLRGLKCERRYGRDYRDGLHEYVAFATSLMRRKEFPDVLIAKMRERYDGDAATNHMRSVANAFALEAYGLTEEQLICMVYAPLPSNGKRLQQYLDRERPALAAKANAIHDLLGKDASPAADGQNELAMTLEALTGLELKRLRKLYRSPAIDLSSADDRTDLTSAILAGDPHKDVIETRHAPDGHVIHEILSGR